VSGCGAIVSDLSRQFGAEVRGVRRAHSLVAAIQRSSARLADWLAVEQRSPNQQVVREEELLALAQLPADQRLAIEMKQLQGCSVAQIAAASACSEAAVGGLLRRGVKRWHEVRKGAEELAWTANNSCMRSSRRT
jgi:DNA-directed RNA polymerase specialized sigma24 family protein